MPDIAQRLNEVEVSNDRLNQSDMKLSSGSQGQLTRIASYQAQRPVAARNGKRVNLALTAYESKSTDGTGVQTINLTHDLVESGATAEDLVIYDDSGNRDQPVSIDYAGDSFDYDDGGAATTIHVFYAAGDQARLVIRKVAPGGTQDDLLTTDVGLLHKRDQQKQGVTFEFMRSILEGVIPTDWTLEVYVDAPYVTRWEAETGDGTTVTAANALLSIPVRRSAEEIEELGRAARHDIAER